MAQTPPYKIPANNLTLMTAQRLSKAADGTFSNLSTALSFLTVLDDFKHQLIKVKEEISPITSARTNMVTVETGSKITVREIKLANAQSKIHLIQNTCEFILFSWTEGTESFAGYFGVGNMDGGLSGKGKQVVSCEFDPIDPGEAQVTYSASA